MTDPLIRGLAHFFDTLEPAMTTCDFCDKAVDQSKGDKIFHHVEDTADHSDRQDFWLCEECHEKYAANDYLAATGQLPPKQLRSSAEAAQDTLKAFSDDDLVAELRSRGWIVRSY